MGFGEKRGKLRSCPMLIPLQYLVDHWGPPHGHRALWRVVPHWGCNSEYRSHRLEVQCCSFFDHQLEYFQGPDAPFVPGIQTHHWGHFNMPSIVVECSQHLSHHMLIPWHMQCSAKDSLLCLGPGMPWEIEFLRLEKISKITESNYWPHTANATTKPCPWVPHLHVF